MGGQLAQSIGSLPSRERGLKFLYYAAKVASSVSLPSRERGLKYLSGSITVGSNRRSLHGSVD